MNRTNTMMMMMLMSCLMASAGCDAGGAPEGSVVELLPTVDAATPPTRPEVAAPSTRSVTSVSRAGVPVHAAHLVSPPTAPPDEPLPDTDGDGIIDALDVCPGVADPDQADGDGDGIGDACDGCTASGPEACDAVDNDCDGLVDEGLLNACGACGAVPDEICDGADNDCDGVIDEGVLNACGACGDAPEEVCDGVDDDCDGVVDEGVLNACGACGPTPVELCNDQDDDCDGEIDERFPNLGRPCSGGFGVCHSGRGAIVCTEDGRAAVCSAEIQPPEGEEVCDGRDNDCDGRTDETFNAGQPCSAGLGACAAHGVYTCNAAGDGTFCPVDAGVPSLEVCDLIDNDCDGQTDEFIPDAWLNACGRCGPVPAERCNGEDDDCDGTVDEGFDLGGACTAAFSELCVRRGTRVCVSPERAACDVVAPTFGECVAAHRHSVAVGREYSCLVRDGRLRCWGAYWGHLADESIGDEPGEMGPDMPILDLGMEVASIAIDDDYGCALSVEGAIKCWGTNRGGSHGQGDEIVRREPDDFGAGLSPVPLGMVATQIDSHRWRTCAVGQEGQVKCFGIGLVQGAESIGDEPGEVEAAAPFDIDMAAVEVAVGVRHVCARDRDGRVKCWGKGGVLGLGDGRARIAPAEMGAALPAVDLDMAVVDLDVSGDTSCAVGVDGRVKCWGWMYDQVFRFAEIVGDAPREMGARLPALPFTLEAIGVSTTGRSTCAWDRDGVVECTGVRQHEGIIGFDHPVERVETGLQVIGLEQSFWHVCALGIDGAVKCWGANRMGQLGTGDEFPRSPAQVERLPALPL